MCKKCNYCYENLVNAFAVRLNYFHAKFFNYQGENGLPGEKGDRGQTGDPGHPGKFMDFYT